jgi:hypothetical protein
MTATRDRPSTPIRALAIRLAEAGLGRMTRDLVEVHDGDEFERMMVEIGDDPLAGAGAATAAFMVTSAPTAKRALAIAQRSTRLAGKVPLPSARAVRYATIAVPIAVRLVATARRGTRELQVLASYVDSELRRAGLDPTAAEVRTITTAVAIDPRHPRTDLPPHRGAGRLAGSWLAHAVRPEREDAHRRRIARLRAAVEQLQPPLPLPS